MSASDFDGRPFVAGSLIGLRVFRYDGDQLRGGIFPVPFEPGENIAHCADHESDWFRKRVTPQHFLGLQLTISMQRISRDLNRGRFEIVTASGRGPFGLPRRRDEVRWVETPPPPHRLAGVGCACGFYAYTDGHNEYAPGGENAIGAPVVEAIIEGYGTCTVGSRGFRAEKARLIALIAAPDEIADRYGVPTYDTRDAALAAHPLTSVAAA